VKLIRQVSIFHLLKVVHGFVVCMDFQVFMKNLIATNALGGDTKMLALKIN
jgi:hypothetical protein